MTLHVEHDAGQNKIWTMEYSDCCVGIYLARRLIHAHVCTVSVEDRDN